MKKNFRSALFAILIGSTSMVSAQEENQKSILDGFEFDANYTGDVSSILAGGLKTGAKYLGMANMGMSFSTEKAGLWKGGQLYISGRSIHGNNLANQYGGENFCADGIVVAGPQDSWNYNILKNLYYDQKFGDNVVELCFGWRDINDWFAKCMSQCHLINISLGMTPVIGANNPAPPSHSNPLLAMLKWNINNNWAIQAGVQNGDHTGYDKDPHNVKEKINGAAFFGELQYHTDDQFSVKLGGFKHNQYKNKLGGYVIAEKKFGDKWGLFGQASFAPKKNPNFIEVEKEGPGSTTTFDPNGNPIKHPYTYRYKIPVEDLDVNFCYFYGDLGVNFYNVFTSKHNDILSFAWMTALLTETTDRYRNKEHIAELSYKYMFNKHISIQPDLQLIINPSSTAARQENVKYSLAGIMRFGVSF